MLRLTRKRKILVGIVVALVALMVVSSVSRRNRAKIVEVQIGPVQRQDLKAVVTASGEIRPRNFVNINSQTFGKILSIAVSEGQAVTTGQELLRMEAVQPQAEVEGQRALVRSAEAAVRAAEASLRTAEAERVRARADFERAQLEWDRSQQLFRGGLIAQSEYDSRKSSFESARAAVDVAEARVNQSEAEQERSRSQLQQARAALSSSEDALHKTIYTSPIDGVVTSLPVHMGEQMVPGIQNSPGSFLMTVADMSEVTAEVKVDESDVVSVGRGQAAEVTIDAFPDSTFHGTVAEIGTTAMLRSTGQSTTQLTTGSQEAKDFKVVVTLAHPPDGVRPGLSATARITTATREKVLSIPIQALSIRRQADIEAGAGDGKQKEAEEGEARAAEVRPGDPAGKQEVQGVFVVKDGRAQFRPVKTGITGVTDIEILEGLAEGDQVVTGSYKVLRELKPQARVRKAKQEQKKSASS